MTEEEWTNGFTRCLGLRLAGDAIEEVDRAGEPIRDDTFLLLLNAHHEPLDFVAARPPHARALGAGPGHAGLGAAGAGEFKAGDQYPLEGRSLALLRLREPPRAVSAAVTAPTRHVPAPARRRPDVRRAPATSCPTWRSSGSATATSRRSSSPARRDSHGYDVADHGALNEALGGDAGVRGARPRRSGRTEWASSSTWSRTTWASSGRRNAWWQDVLEHGPASQFASFFDIDWEPLKPELRNRVLLPILEDHYGRVLEHQGELRLQYEDGALPGPLPGARVLPIDPGTLSADPGRRDSPISRTGSGRADAHVRELQSIVAAAAAPAGPVGARTRSAGPSAPARRGAGQAPAGRPRARVPRGEGATSRTRSGS